MSASPAGDVSGGDASAGHAPAGDAPCGDASAGHVPRAIAAIGPAGLILIALVLAGLVVAVALRLQPALVAAAAAWLVACGVPLALIDLRIRRLPDALTGTALAGTAILLLLAAASTGRWTDLAVALAGAVIVAAFFGLLALARPGSAGLGDAKLGLSTGALAAWFGWGVLLDSVVAAFLLAAMAGLWLLGTRRASLSTGMLPFGPFLLAGCLGLVLLHG